ncbi:MAG TPA: glycosyl hydrolase, partial [Thermoleophilaceae bacterium]|nr:glycosyl hydrolase [Thermoleophilaceae bacterium]
MLLACLPAAAQAAPYSSHSQLYACCTDAETKEAMFREAKDSGAAYIRVDLQMEDMFSRGRAPDWAGPDEVAALSRRFDLPVLAVLVGVPRENTDCLDITDWMGSFRCAPVDAAEWGEQAGQVAAHLDGVIDHFQIGNEPDGDWAFFGDAADYARMLSAAYDEIHAQAPGATVVLGPTMRLNSQGASWLDQVFRTPGTDAAAKFDVASMHLRGWMTQMTDAMQQRRAFLRGWGRDVPMWITEHGYSADSAWQFDPAYRGGEDAQASYLATSLPLLAKAGAAQVFVTLRDGGDAQYAREGIVGGTGPAYRRKPAWYAVRDAA